MVEMIITFALLSLFMVAATRVISYTTSIYYNAKGSATGLEVSTMISNKIVGMLEGAINDPVVTANAYAGSDMIQFTDATESAVTISAQQQKKSDGTNLGNFLVIHYDEAAMGTVQYEPTDYKYDVNSYMGYEISELKFENPGSEYPENVIKLQITVHSEKYGDFSSVYYIKAVNATKVIYN